ncbi:MAG: hypothetical protein J7L55_04190 [Desulfurococcales archaeon]|nr:hypothetical protein [Desulfurococcales archaeon]
MKATRKAGRAVIRLTATTFYHSTEDPDKVKTALLNVLFNGGSVDAEISESVVEGHYGNRIGILTCVIEGKKAEDVFRRIVCSMNNVDRNILKATLPNRVGVRPSHMHIRLSKQDAYLGRIVLLDGDDVIKVSVTVNGVRKVSELQEYLDGIIEGCRK